VARGLLRATYVTYGTLTTPRGGRRQAGLDRPGGPLVLFDVTHKYPRLKIPMVQNPPLPKPIMYTRVAIYDSTSTLSSPGASYAGPVPCLAAKQPPNALGIIKGYKSESLPSAIFELYAMGINAGSVAVRSAF